MLGRRFFLFAMSSAALAWADVNQEIADVVGDMAGALANDDPEAFLSHLSKALPDRAVLRDNLYALVNSANVTSEVEILSLKAAGERQRAEMDWSMRIQSKSIEGPLEQRRETITLELIKEGKHWRVVSLAPVNFFRPLGKSQ